MSPCFLLYIPLFCSTGLASGKQVSFLVVTTPNSHGVVDSSHSPITSQKLNGQNYLQWSQLVMMFICGNSKKDYLTADAAVSTKLDLKYKGWNIENNMIMAWLINSINNYKGDNFLLYTTAKKKNWDATREACSSNENTVEVFEIKCLLHELCQGDLPITQYFNLFT